MQDDFSTSPIEPTSEAAKIQKQERLAAKKLALAQENSKISMREFANEAAFTPTIMTRRFETIEERMRKKDLEKKELEKAEEKIVDVEKIEEISEKYERRNPELRARSLQLLQSHIKPYDTHEELLKKTMEHFQDLSLADEAFEFLEEANSGEMLDKIRLAKENLNATYGREILAGRNIGTQAREFSEKGLGTPTGLRDLYREITGNPRNASSLFMELNDKFTYAKMKVAIDFLLHSLGADLKSKGPSISPGQLHTLMTEARNLLAILWVYNFFKGRMDLINDSFERAGLLLPPRINFEMLAKMFVQFLLERYPTMDKVFQLALKMGISGELLAQIILFTQMRDAVRGVAPKLFRTEQHRHDVLMSFIEALEELEDQYEGDEESEEEEEEES